MNTKRCLLVAALAAVAVGGVPMNTLHAQVTSAPQPPAFYISEFEVTDPEGIKPYSAAVDSTFEPFGGRYVVRGGKVASLEGDPPKRIVIIAFPNIQQVQAWYNSPAYQKLKPIRHQLAKSRVCVVEGIAR